MQIIHDFNISIEEYIANLKSNNYPILTECPHCHDRLIKNGFYSRYVITLQGTYIIHIRRYRCKHCGLTISILPSFLLPHFQRCLNSIFQSIREYIFNRKFLLYRRAVFLYLQRFKSNIPGIISFFRDTIDKKISFGKRKTIKLIEMIKSCPTHTFSRRFHNHFNTGFMAL
jgi:hypothetical protein